MADTGAASRARARGMTAGLRGVTCVLGDSQIHALREGSAEKPFEHRFSIQFAAPGRMLRCFTGNPSDDEAAYVRSLFFRKIRAWSGPVVASLGGGEHARTWSYTAATRWTTDGDGQDGAPVVAPGLLEAYFDHLFNGFVAFVALHTREQGVPGAILSFPPVPEDNVALAALRNAAAAAEKLPPHYRAEAITPAEQRRETWRLVESAKRRLCAAHGLAYIAAPEDAAGPGGFLKPALVGDSFHANGAYGRLVLRDLLVWSDALR